MGHHTEYRFELFKGGVLKRRWFFRFVSPNGKKMAQSEGYSRRIDAVSAINTLAAAAKSAPVVYLDEEAA